MICPNCGAENREDYKFCGNCGTPRAGEHAVLGTVIVPEAQYQPPPPYDAAQPPYGTPAPQPSVVVPAAPVKPRRRGKWLLTCGIIVVVLICLAVVAVGVIAFVKPELLPFDIPFLSSNNRILVGFPNRNGETDLYLLRLGQQTDRGVLLAENTTQPDGNMLLLRNGEYWEVSGSNHPFGGFVTAPEAPGGQEYLLYWYANDDEEIVVGRLPLREKTPAELLTLGAPPLWGYVLPNGLDTFFVETADDANQCYISINGARAEQVTEGLYCWLTASFTTAYAYEVEDEQATLRLLNLADNSESTPLDAQSGVQTYHISSDGSRVAYLNTEETPQMVLLDQDGATMAEGEGMYAIVRSGFARFANIAYFVGENDDGEMELYTLSDSGSTLVTTDLSIGAELTDDGAYLAYVSGSIEGEKTLYVRDIASGNDVEVVSGQDLAFSVVSSLGRIFITNLNLDADGELTVYSVNLDGSGLVTLYSEVGMFLDTVYYVPGQPYIILQLFNNEDGLYTLYATRPDQESGMAVAEGWVQVTGLNVSSDGLQFLYTGREDEEDDGLLYLAHLDTDQTDTLDEDAYYISNAVFSERGTEVIYTALTGDSPNDVEIRRVKVTGEEPPEVLYPKAFLVSAQWGSLNPFNSTFFNGVSVSTSYCPGATPIAVDETLSGSLEAGVSDCYRFRGTAGETYTFWISGVEAGGVDTTLTLYTRQGDYIDSDDLGLDGTNPRLIAEIPEDGMYYIEVTGVNEATGNYNLTTSAGSNFCPGVTSLSVGVPLQGTLNPLGSAYFSIFGQASQELSLWVVSTDMDPSLTLFDGEGSLINTNDDGRDGIDPLLNVTLPEEGNYCVEVSSYSGESFEINTAEGTQFCPGAGSIALDQTINGTIEANRRICYAFTANANTMYSFVVESPTGTDTVLELYGEDGYYIDEDDDSGGGLNPRLTFTVDRTGTYYIIIRGYGSNSGDYELTYVEGSGFCIGAEQIYMYDDVDGHVGEDAENCYIYEGNAGDLVMFWAESDQDTTLTLYDEFGNEIAYNDDGGEGLNPLINITLPYDGTYFIVIRGFAGRQADYTLMVDEGVEDSFADAIYLSPGVRTSGAITYDNSIYLASYDYTGYGVIYYFDGVAGQSVTINVYAQSMGSQLDPWTYLFDSTYNILIDDDNSGSNNDSLISNYVLPYTGRYYILIIDYSGSFGSTYDYFYDILLTIR